MTEIGSRAAHWVQFAQIEPNKRIPLYELSEGAITSLEYLKRGDMYKAIHRMWDVADLLQQVEGTDRPRLPDQLYWFFFICIWRMYCAMAWPPAMTAMQEGTLDEFLADKTPIEEIPDLRFPPAQIVHFDIDPRNILVGDFSDDPRSRHYFAPNLKLSDFGLMELIDDPGTLDNAKRMRALKKVGKPETYAPEQFTSEWDAWQGDRNVPPRQWPAQVAGKYGHKTNLFQLGHIMYNILTRAQMPEVKPEPMYYFHHPEH
ncbi:hypothetical protein QBC44DRAFT_245513, partial [Cladorrhinum sp. PSN332]